MAFANAKWGKQKAEIENQEPETGNRKLETKDQELETNPSLLTSAATAENWNPETGGTRCPTLAAQDPSRETRNSELETRNLLWLQTACRAGAIVLLVGFWFDGGLFKLATGATFWILLELGKPVDSPKLMVDSPETA